MDLRDLAPPQVEAAGWVMKATIAAAIAVLLGVMVWMTFIAPGRTKAAHDVATGRATGLVGTAQGAAGENAANVIAKGAGRETIIRERTNNNYVEITKQPGAGDPVSDALDAAGRRAICLRASAASLPDCQRLREADPGGMEEGR